MSFLLGLLFGLLSIVILMVLPLAMAVSYILTLVYGLRFIHAVEDFLEDTFPYTILLLGLWPLCMCPFYAFYVFLTDKS